MNYREHTAIVIGDFAPIHPAAVIANGLVLAKAARLESDLVYAASPISTLATLCHGISKFRGWYNDPKTGESITRNTGEVIALMHSEVSEAWEALDRHPGKFDDKVPHHHEFAVEIADAIIRISDTIGAKEFGALETLQIAEPEYRAYFVSTNNASHAEFLMYVHLALSNALEGDRKSRESEVAKWLVIALLLLVNFAWRLKVEIGEVVFEKCVYNIGRQDHAIENRAKAGGKSY